MELNSACHICGGTMKADDNTKPQMRCDKCGHQVMASIDLSKQAVKKLNRHPSRRSH